MCRNCIQCEFFRDLNYSNRPIFDFIIQTIGDVHLKPKLKFLVVTAFVLALFVDVITIRILRELNRMQTYQKLYTLYITMFNIVNFVFVMMLFGHKRDVENTDVMSFWFAQEIHFFLDTILTILTIQVAFTAIMAFDSYLFTFEPIVSVRFRRYLIDTIVGACVYLLLIPMCCFVAILFNIQTCFTLDIFCGSVYVSLFLYVVIILIYYLRNLRRIHADINNIVVLSVVRIKIVIWVCLMRLLFFGVHNNLFIYGCFQFVTVIFLFLAILSPVIQLVAFWMMAMNLV